MKKTPSSVIKPEVLYFSRKEYIKNMALNSDSLLVRNSCNLPKIPQSRWSKSTERRIGEIERQPTFLFNGDEKEVTHLYKDMDLSVNY